MLFNSYEFIFLFLPLAILVFFCLGKFRLYGAAMFWLVAASLFFYGYWNPSYLALILASITINSTIGSWLNHWQKRRYRQWLLVAGVGINLFLLDIK
jgi:uncharacterized membrane protein YfcA